MQCFFGGSDLRSDPLELLNFLYVRINVALAVCGGG